MDDLELFLRAEISRAAEDAANVPDFTTIAHEGTRRRRRRSVVALVAAGAAVIALLGGLQLVGPRQVQPAAPPTSAAVTPMPMPTGDTTIRPGTYLVPRSAVTAVDYTLTFPQGWRVQYGRIYHGGSNELAGIELSAYVVDYVYSDSCAGEKGTVEPVGPTSADLVAALLVQPGTDATGPIATTLGGRPATRVDLRAPRDTDHAACRLRGQGLQIWHSAPADAYFVLLTDGTASAYVLDVDGKRVVFVTQYRAGTPAADRAELQSVLDSIRFP